MYDPDDTLPPDETCYHDCPFCGYHNLFRGFVSMDVYVCEGCGKPVEIEGSVTDTKAE